MFKFIAGIIVIGLIAGIGFSSKSSTKSEIKMTTDSLGYKIQSHEFGADLYMGTHTDIDEFLEVVKKKYEGRAAILDLWGTFCKPCLSDFKNSPAKKAELKEKMDVHVVYLCAGMSSNIKEWQKIVERDQLVGDHIYMDRTMTMAYREKFGIKRYPNYILLDKEGNFKTKIISAVSDIQVDQFQQHLD